MPAYYNEIDPYCAFWLRRLIAAGHIADGDVDERSIKDVTAADVGGYDQCHFFAGIGGWSLALRLACWPDDRPVWTGSCPCQPFSAAGKRSGGKDDRHLWPHWLALIRERRPDVVFGENVEAAIGWGWLDAVLGDLEAEGYATGAMVLGAHSVGAPHIRQRLWFVADAGRERGESQRHDVDAAARGHQGQGDQRQRLRADDRAGGAIGGPRLEERAGIGCDDGAQRQTAERASSHWADLEWLPCSDGKARPTRPGLFPLAHGISARVGKLRAVGNAIVPQVAAEFVRAYMESRE